MDYPFYVLYKSQKTLWGSHLTTQIFFVHEHTTSSNWWLQYLIMFEEELISKDSNDLVRLEKIHFDNQNLQFFTSIKHNISWSTPTASRIFLFNRKSKHSFEIDLSNNGFILLVITLVITLKTIFRKDIGWKSLKEYG